MCWDIYEKGSAAQQETIKSIGGEVNKEKTLEHLENTLEIKKKTSLSTHEAYFEEPSVGIIRY